MKRTMMTLIPLTTLALTQLVYAGQPIDERRSLEAGGNVSVENVAGDINVSVWDRNELHLTGTLDDDVEELEITETASGIQIRVRIPDNQRNVDDTELNLKVPASANLDIEGISSDITIVGSRADHISAESVSGDIEVSAEINRAELGSVSGEVSFEGSAQRASVETVSGNIDLLGVSGEAQVGTVSGDINYSVAELERGRFETVSGDLELVTSIAEGGKLTVESMSGDVVVRLPAGQAGEFEAQSFSGDIRSDFGSVEDESFGPGSELSHIEGNSGTTIRLESFSGDIRIQRR
jgi:DUF4097 and DUF4098 domain-containing protein YvlB